MKKEPVLLYSLLAAILNVVQVIALPVSPSVHSLILVVAAAVAAWLARQRVTPTA